MATGFPVKANYATGDVLTAANMNDLSGTVNYLQYMPPRNPILNSAFNVWQRGTSIAVGAVVSAYTADRWAGGRNNNVAGLTVSRQVTGDTTNLPNIQYCARIQRDSGNTSAEIIRFRQAFETVNSIPFTGKTVTVSFYARAGANFSASGGTMTSTLINGTGTDQAPIGTITGENNVANAGNTLTTTWQRFTISGTVPTNSTQLFIAFQYTPVGTAGAADYYEITGVQLELGSVANTYMPNQPTYQGELAACQRYYVRLGASNGATTTAYDCLAQGSGSNTTTVGAWTRLPVTMRVAPTSIDYANIAAYDQVSVIGTPDSVNIVSAEGGKDYAKISFNKTGSFTQYRPYTINNNNNTSGYLGFSAEL